MPHAGGLTARAARFIRAAAAHMTRQRPLSEEIHNSTIEFDGEKFDGGALGEDGDDDDGDEGEVAEGGVDGVIEADAVGVDPAFARDRPPEFQGEAGEVIVGQQVRAEGEGDEEEDLRASTFYHERSE